MLFHICGQNPLGHSMADKTQERKSMQDRIRVKKIVKAVVEKANQVKEALNIDRLLEQAKAQAKRLDQKIRDKERNKK